MTSCFADSKQKIQKIMDQNGGVAILDFRSKSCTDCGKLQNYLDTLNTEKKIPLIKIDVDDCKELCQCYKCEKAPCFAVVRQNWQNVTECRECHDTKEVLDIFNCAVDCRDKMQKKMK